MALAPVPGGKASSVRSRASQKSGGADLTRIQPFTDDLMSKIDLRGSDDMTIEMVWIGKGGVSIAMKPTGLRCIYCPLVDTNWDPVGIMRDKVKRPVRWGRPPMPTGVNHPGPCYYCMKYYKGRIWQSRVPHVTESDYRQSLGQDEQKLKLHCACAIQIILVMVASPAGDQSKMKWDAVESVALKVVKKTSVIKKRPGFLFYPDILYTKKYGDFNTNGMAMSANHRPWAMDGKKGFLVPKEQVTEIDFQDEMAVELESCVGDTDTTSLGALQAMHGTISASLWNESSGGVDKATDAMLNLPLSSLELPGGDAADAQTEGSLGVRDLMSFSGGAPTLSVDAPVVPAIIDAQPAPKSTAVSRKKNPAICDAPARQGEAAGEANQKKPSRGGGVGAKGRPAVKWEEDVSKECKAFVDAAPDDELYWGSEYKTQVKQLTKLESQLTNRIRNTQELTIAEESKTMRKKIKAIIKILETSGKFGMASTELKKEFDAQVCMMRLPPQVDDFEWPAHLKWAMRKMVIHEDTCEDWHTQTSSSQLREHGAQDIGKEQTVLYQQKMASVLRIPDAETRTHQLRDVFDPEDELDLEDCISGFTGAMRVIVSYEDFDDLRERIGLLTEALDHLEIELPACTHGMPNKPGTPLGSTLYQFPSGKELVAAARVNLEKAKTTLELLEPFEAQVKTLSELFRDVALTTCDPETFQKITQSFEAVAQVFAHNALAENTLPSFMPQPDSHMISDVSSKFMSMLICGGMEVLQLLAHSSLDMEHLKQWSAATAGARPRIAQAHAIMTQASTVTMLTQDGGYATCHKLCGIIGWFYDASSAVEATPASLRASRKLYKDLFENALPTTGHMFGEQARRINEMVVVVIGACPSVMLDRPALPCRFGGRAKRQVRGLWRAAHRMYVCMYTFSIASQDYLVQVRLLMQHSASCCRLVVGNCVNHNQIRDCCISLGVNGFDEGVQVTGVLGIYAFVCALPCTLPHK